MKRLNEIVPIFFVRTKKKEKQSLFQVLTQLLQLTCDYFMEKLIFFFLFLFENLEKS